MSQEKSFSLPEIKGLQGNIVDVHFAGRKRGNASLSLAQSSHEVFSDEKKTIMYTLSGKKLRLCTHFLALSSSSLAFLMHCKLGVHAACALVNNPSILSTSSVWRRKTLENSIVVGPLETFDNSE